MPRWQENAWYFSRIALTLAFYRRHARKWAVAQFLEGRCDKIPTAVDLLAWLKSFGTYWRLLFWNKWNKILLPLPARLPVRHAVHEMTYCAQDSLTSSHEEMVKHATFVNFTQLLSVPPIPHILSTAILRYSGSSISLLSDALNPKFRTTDKTQNPWHGVQDFRLWDLKRAILQSS